MQKEEGAPKRFGARHKTQAELRLLRGQDIDPMSRELGVAAATLPRRRDTFLEAGKSGRKAHPVNKSIEVGRLREKIGEQAMGNEGFAWRSPGWSKVALWPEGGRGNAPSRLGLHGEELRLALVCVSGRFLVPRYTGDVGARLRLLQPNDAAFKAGMAIRPWLST